MEDFLSLINNSLDDNTRWEVLEKIKTSVMHDALKHDELAAHVLNRISLMGRGSVVAVQSPWGSGKTDLLCRIAVRAMESADTYLDAIALNPWKQGIADLVGPLAVEVYRRIQAKSTKESAGILSNAKKLLPSILLKGASLMARTTGIPADLDEAYRSAKKMFDELAENDFESKIDSLVERDRVAALGSLFKGLVEEYYKVLDGDNEKRILVLVDDLDRCLPERQVSFLEAISFLVSAGANVDIIITIDPFLANHAVFSRYRTKSIDADGFLEKLISFRIDLPLPDDNSQEKLIHTIFRKPLSSEPSAKEIGTLIDKGGIATRKEIQAQARVAWCVQSLRNPRIVTKMIRRLALWSEEKRQTVAGISPYDIVFWIAICERWPIVRKAFQESKNHGPDKVEKTVVELSKRGRRWAIVFLHAIADRPGLTHDIGWGSILTGIPTTSTPGQIETELGDFLYRHLTHFVEQYCKAQFENDSQRKSLFAEFVTRKQFESKVMENPYLKQAFERWALKIAKVDDALVSSWQ